MLTDGGTPISQYKYMHFLIGWLCLIACLVLLSLRTRTPAHTTAELDDVELVQQAQDGDLSSFNQLVGRYQKFAYHVAYRVLGDGDAAADAVQEGFIAAYQAIDSFSDGSFKAWLARIVTNKCYDALRREKRRPKASLDALLLDADDAESPYRTVSPERPDEAAERAELADVLNGAILELPADQRITLVLADVEGFSYAEIADVTDVELGTVKSRLYRARRKVRDMLLKQQELLPGRYRFIHEL